MTDFGADEKDGEPFHLLFVCTGNTCRSPMAEAVAREALARRGWGQVVVRSAGVAAGKGQPASPQAVRAAGEEGLDLSSHRAAPVTPELLEWADLILTMSRGHLAALEGSAGGKAALITAFVQSGSEEEEWVEGVADPVGGTDEEYRRTLEQIRELVDRALDRLEPLVAP